MHHWRVHPKVEFSRLSPDVRTWGVLIIFHYVQATSELKKFRQDPGQMGGSIPQQTCNIHLTSLKSGNEMIVWSNVNALKNIGWGASIIFQLLMLISEMYVLH